MVVTVEYPGYSIYKGEPCESSIMRDAEQVIQFLTECLDVSINDIVLMGSSLGSVVAMNLAAMHPNVGMLVLSCY